MPPLVENSQVSLPHVLVDPLEPLGRERRAGRAHAAQRAQVAPVGGLDAGLHAARDVAGAGAEARHAGAVGEVPEHSHVGVARTPVVEEDPGVGEEGADEEVPHHPPGGREPEEAVPLLRVDVEMKLLQVLEQDAALPVHDRLREPGGAGGVEHPQRVVEGHLLEAQILPLPIVRQRIPGHPALQRSEVRLRVEVWQDDRPLERGDLALEAGHGLHTVEVAAVVAVPVDREQHLRLDLGEAVHHAPRPEVGRATRPDGSQACAREEGGEGLRDVRHVGDDAVAALDPEAAQAGRDPCRRAAELAPGHLGLVAQLRGVHHRDPVVRLPAEDVLGVAQLRPLEPARARHRAIGEHALVRPLRPNREEVPDRLPERLELRDRPPPELVVVREREPPLRIEPAHVARQRRALACFFRRLPEERAAPVGRRLAPHGYVAGAVGVIWAVQNGQRLAADGTSLRHSGHFRTSSSTGGSVLRRAISAFTGLTTRKNTAAAITTKLMRR